VINIEQHPTTSADRAPALGVAIRRRRADAEQRGEFGYVHDPVRPTVALVKQGSDGGEVVIVQRQGCGFHVATCGPRGSPSRL
jgi:hypothetical protein